MIDRKRVLEIRRKNFAVLRAVFELVPDGGTLTVAQIAERAGVSRNWTRHALSHFRAWRVFWLRYQKPDAFEIRFQRQVVLGLLAAQRVMPRRVKVLMESHRRKRETVAPRRRWLTVGEVVLLVERILNERMLICAGA